MARKSKSYHSSSLANALKFVGMSGAEYCSIGNNLITAFTNDICMGHTIEEDLNAQAHIKNLYKSLCNSNEKTAITQVNLEKLHVNSGELQVYIPCAKKIEHPIHDNFQYEINLNYLKGIETLLPLVSAFGEHISLKTIMDYSGCLYATNRFILVEFEHKTHSMFFTLGKKFCDLLIKSKKNVKSLGYSKNSISVQFQDESWIMGRNASEDWINPFEILKENIQLQTISTELKIALNSVPDFSDEGLVYCFNECLHSHQNLTQGASYPVPGLPDGGIYGIKEMKFLLKNAEWINFSDSKTIYFAGQNLRGAISSRG